MTALEVFDPPFLTPDYHITMARGPSQALIDVPADWFDRAAGPAFGSIKVRPDDSDLTRVGNGKPLGLKILLRGKVVDGDGAPLRGALIEIWQANASGRYVDLADPWGMPLDPNFIGAGRCLTDDHGDYRFSTIRPAPYPTINRGATGWRAAHIHFSLFGRGVTDRIVTQMYFPDDPLLAADSIFLGVLDPRARQRLVAAFDLEGSTVDLVNAPGFTPAAPDGSRRLMSRREVAEQVADSAFERPEPARSALAFRFDIVLRGRSATPMEPRA